MTHSFAGSCISRLSLSLSDFGFSGIASTLFKPSSFVSKADKLDNMYDP
jgi:hypothetical protein